MILMVIPILKTPATPTAYFFTSTFGQCLAAGCHWWHGRPNDFPFISIFLLSPVRCIYGWLTIACYILSVGGMASYDLCLRANMSNLAVYTCVVSPICQYMTTMNHESEKVEDPSEQTIQGCATLTSLLCLGMQIQRHIQWHLGTSVI